MSSSISIIIITLGIAPTLQKCVQKISLQLKSNDELVIISNKKISWPTTSHRIKFFVEPTLSQSQARNVGITKTKNSWIAFIDDDCLPTNRWMKAMRRTMHSEAVCIQGRCSIYTRTNVWEVLENVSMDVYHRIPGKYSLMDGPGIKLTTKNILLHKQEIPFHPMFPSVANSGVHDDSLFLLKLNRIGIRPTYDGAMAVYHAPKTGMARYIKKLITDGRSLYWKNVHNKQIYSVLEAVGWAQNTSPLSKKFHRTMELEVKRYVERNIASTSLKSIFYLFWHVRPLIRTLGYFYEWLSQSSREHKIISYYLTHY